MPARSPATPKCSAAAVQAGDACGTPAAGASPSPNCRRRTPSPRSPTSSARRGCAGLHGRRSIPGSAAGRCNTGTRTHPRRNTLNRVNAGRRAAGIYSFSAITLGSRIDMLGDRTAVSYSFSTDTRSRNTAFTASCHAHTDNGKYDSGRKSAFRTRAGKCIPPSGKTCSFGAPHYSWAKRVDRPPDVCAAKTQCVIADERRPRNPAMPV